MVGVLSVSDPDNYGPAGVWQSHNCSAVDTANGRFTVDSNVVKVSVEIRCKDLIQTSRYEFDFRLLCLT